MGLNNDANLVLHLKLDEAVGAGTFADSSASGNNGTDMSTVFTTGVAGKFGKCITCTASTANHGITLDSAVSLTADFTVSVYVKAGVNNDASGIFGSAAGTNTFYELFTSGVNTVSNLYVGGFEALSFDAAFPTGAWTHLVLHRSSGTLTTYLNGTAQTDTESNAGTVTIEYVATRLPARTESWNGQFDDFRVYSRALTLLEIITLRDNPYTNAAISPGVSSNIVLPIAYSPDRTQY